MKLLFLSLAVIILHCSAQTTICPDPRYSFRPPANSLCYLYYQTPNDYSAANRSCVRDGGILVSIDDAAENEYIQQIFTINGRREFWIGLNDIEREGVFRWLNSSVDSMPGYLNWSGGFPVDNKGPLDCAKFTNDGWRVHTGYCTTSDLPYVCKMKSCRSLDGQYCIGSEPTVVSTSVNVVAIVVPIIIVAVVLVLIVVVVILLCMWKFSNDAFRHYCCCCLLAGSKSAIHSIQQENQRLRHELSQHKVSLSGRFQSGQLTGERELSGVPDGRGGVLPTIKQPLSSGSKFSPTTTENRMLQLGGGPTTPTENNPPPLVMQRPSQTTPFSRQTSLTSTAPFFFGSLPPRPGRQSLPVSFGGGVTVSAKPSIPAPVRGGGGGVTVPITPASPQQQKTTESESESGSESEDEEKNTK